MSARIRAEAAIAVSYMVALPFVVIFAGMVQIFVLGWIWVPGVPYWLALLGSAILAPLTAALAFMVIRVGIEELGSGVPAARWPLRLAPIVVSAVALTTVALRGAPEGGTVNPLIVFPALILWGAAAGEWAVHRCLARGRSASELFGRFFLFTFAGIAWLMIAAWVLNNPRAEQAVAREKCEGLYARARTPADSAGIDRWTPVVALKEWTRPCAELRSAAPR